MSLYISLLFSVPWDTCLAFYFYFPFSFILTLFLAVIHPIGAHFLSYGVHMLNLWSSGDCLLKEAGECKEKDWNPGPS